MCKIVALLLFFTFSSRTIHYLMLPKVVATKTVWGSMIDEYAKHHDHKFLTIHLKPLFP
jgi:hypothetical protein